MKKVARLIPALLAALLPVACQPPAPPPPASVKIGLNLELTGDIQAVGASARNAAEMFAAEVNAAGGIQLAGSRLPVELVIRDNAAEPAQAASVTQQLVTRDDVTAIIGPNSSACALPASDVAEGLKCVMITPWSTSPATTLDRATGVGKRYVFRACFTDAAQTRALARFALRDRGARTAAVLHDEAGAEAAAVFREAFAAGGGTVVADETYAAGDSDFAAPLGRIVAAAPDVLFLPAYYPDVPPIVRQGRELGLQATLLGSDGWIAPDLLTVAGADVEGAYLCSHFSTTIRTPEAERFIAAYQARHGRPPDDVAALTYDACGLIAEALRKSGKDSREAVREALAQIHGYRGVTGVFHFEPGSGDPAKTAPILQVKDGVFTWATNAEP